ncbi:MAG TPA: hypothetical protein VGZ93_07325 [Candidatus Methylacidiphilales bacterium]|jgi:hypothetical protein|nr:hypothetical protein [Candidatus Methylacidiphilales bacterium]
MKHRVIYFSPALVLALFAAPLAAWADATPDFDDDAKPILRMQPGLLEYVESRFDVKDTGKAKYPGDDDRPPSPPFIFRARPIGSHGPYNLRLLIQPGPPGHILGIVDMTKVHLAPPANESSQPAVANQPPPPTQPPPQAPAPSAPTPSSQPSEPSADTPSGPIMNSGDQPPPSNAPEPSLAPPPDLPPPAQ